MGKMLSPHFLSRIIVKLAGNKDMHKLSDEFEFGTGQTFHYGVICLWAFPLTLNVENLHFFPSYYELK